jgi:hypothetical protein
MNSILSVPRIKVHEFLVGILFALGYLLEYFATKFNELFTHIFLSENENYLAVKTMDCISSTKFHVDIFGGC